MIFLRSIQHRVLPKEDRCAPLTTHNKNIILRKDTEQKSKEEEENFLYLFSCIGRGLIILTEQVGIVVAQTHLAPTGLLLPEKKTIQKIFIKIIKLPHFVKWIEYFTRIHNRQINKAIEQRTFQN